MATEPDDIVVEAASPANDDRVKEILHGNVDFEAKQSTGQAPKKPAGQCRMVVEIPFLFSKEFLGQKSIEHERWYRDGVEYLRRLKLQYEQGDIDLGDLIQISIEHGDNGIRIDAAK